MAVHKETVCIPANELNRINRLLAIECFEEMTDEEMLRQGANTNVYEGVFAVDFDDGSFLTWDLCSGSSNYYDNVVWTSPDGDEDITLDCEYELDDIEVEIESELYIVKVVRE